MRFYFIGFSVLDHTEVCDTGVCDHICIPLETAGPDGEDYTCSCHLGFVMVEDKCTGKLAFVI